MAEAKRDEVGSDRRFFAATALAALITMVFGFSATYYLVPFTGAAPAVGSAAPRVLPGLVHVHALIFTAWVLLFGVQAGLVASGRTTVHRRLGIVAFALIPLMLVIGMATAVRGARDGWNPGGPYRDGFEFMIVGVVDIFIFVVLAAAALAYRRRPAIHKRLMLFATLGGLMWPAITRIPPIRGNLVLMFGWLGLQLLATPARDFFRRSPSRWLSLALALAVAAAFPLRTAIGRTDAWHRLAEWMTGH